MVFHSEDMTSPQRDSYTLYRLIEKSTRKSAYVGLVLTRRYRQSFYRHYTDDVRSPWHAHQWPAGIYQRSSEYWPYYPDIIEHVRNFTRLEARAAQQYWWERYRGDIGLLKDHPQPLSRTQFMLLRGKGCWDGYLKGFPNGWAPSL